jgi:hypothetical protein
MVNQKKAFQFAGLIVKHAQPIPVCMEQVLFMHVILDTLQHGTGTFNTSNPFKHYNMDKNQGTEQHLFR